MVRQRMKHWSSILVMLTVLSSCIADRTCSITDPCSPDRGFLLLDLASFDEIPAFNELDFSGIVPFRSFDHWQLRALAGLGFETLWQGGPLGFEQLPASVRTRIDTIGSHGGFTFDCSPATCGRHFLSVEGDSVRFWWRPAEARSFLGEVDAAVEAILIVKTFGYWFGAKSERLGGIRSDGADFLLLAGKVVSSCYPVQVNRVLLRVSRSGVLTELLDEIITFDKDGCFVV